MMLGKCVVINLMIFMTAFDYLVETIIKNDPLLAQIKKGKETTE